jgi:hypothetical protein
MLKSVTSLVEPLLRYVGGGGFPPNFKTGVKRGQQELFAAAAYILGGPHSRTGNIFDEVLKEQPLRFSLGIIFAYVSSLTLGDCVVRNKLFYVKIVFVKCFLLILPSS